MPAQPFVFPVEAGKIHEFALAMYDDTPDYHNAEAARDRGLPGIMAPPTFAIASTFHMPGGRLPLPEGIDVRYTLNGGQEFVYHRPIRAGDVLTGETRLVGVERKEGRRAGTLTLYTIETEFRNQAGEVALMWRLTLIQTSQAVPR